MRLQASLRYCSPLIVSSFVILLIATLVPARFETNDDVTMMLQAMGYWDGVPTGHLVFIDFVLGSAVAFFYRNFPALPWYPLLLLGCQAIGWFQVWRGLRYSSERGASLIGISLLFALFGFGFAITLQFTATAIFLGSASLFANVRRPHASFGSSMLEGVGVAMAFLLRSGAGLCVMIAWLPCIVLLRPAIGSNGNKTWIRNLVPTLVLSTMIVGACYYSSALEYRKAEGWSAYMAYNVDRGEVHGDRALTLNSSDLKDIGLTKTGFEMLRAWFFTDQDTFGHATMKRILAKRSASTKWVNIHPFMVAYLVGTLGLATLCILMIVFLSVAKEREGVRALMCLSWFFLVFLLLVFQYGNPPARVTSPLLLTLMLALEMSSGALSRFAGVLRELRRWRSLGLRLPLFIIVVLLAASEAAATTWAARHNRKDARDFARDLRALDQSTSKAFIEWPNSLELDRISPFVTKDELPKSKLIDLGWRVFSPSWIRTVQGLTGGVDVIGGLLAGKSELLCSRLCDEDRIKTLQLYIRESRRVENVTFEGRCLVQDCSLKSWRAQVGQDSASRAP